MAAAARMEGGQSSERALPGPEVAACGGLAGRGGGWQGAPWPHDCRSAELRAGDRIGGGVAMMARVGTANARSWMDLPSPRGVRPSGFTSCGSTLAPASVALQAAAGEACRGHQGEAVRAPRSR